MSYLIYLRKSRADIEAEARGEGETLARHERILTELAARQNLPVPPGGIYRELVSAETIAARPVMQQVLQDVEAGKWNGVIVMEVERLARGDSIDQGIVAQAFKYTSTRIVTPVKTYDPENEADEEFFEYSLFMSRREYKTIRRRLQTGRIAAVQEGRYLGNRAIYGYTRAKAPEGKGHILIPHPEQSQIVRAIFDWYTNGIDGETYGIDRIARKLNAIGVQTATNKVWSRMTVYKILRNPTYIGFIRWNQKVQKTIIENGQRITKRVTPDNPILAKGLHDPIITKDVFDKAQQMLSAHEKYPGNPERALKNPLSGILRCATCGKMMIRKPGRAHHPDQLTCMTITCPTSGCNLSVVEDAILDTLRYWLAEYEAAPSPEDAPPAPPAIDVTAAARADLTAQITTLTQQQSRASDLLEQGVYTTEYYLQRTADITARIAAAESSLAALSVTPPPTTADRIITVRPHLRTLLDAYAAAQSPADKNQLLKTVIDTVYYTKTQRGSRWHDHHQDLSLEVIPKYIKYSDIP